MNVVERSIEFLAQWRDASSVAPSGSSPAEIAALEARIGRPCSALHRTFLERMGEETGSSDLGEFVARPAVLLEQRETALELLPPGIELFAAPTGEDDDDLYLVHDAAGTDDAKIVRHPSLEFEETGGFDLARAEAVAGGLGELLCLPGFSRYYVERQPHVIALLDRELHPDALARVRDIADAFGLEPYWFSNDWTYAGHRDGLVVVAKQAPGWFLSVGVAGPERWAFAAVAGTLRHRLALTDFR